MTLPRILVVDDNTTNLKLVSKVLESEGYEILLAKSAEEAQEIIRSKPPSLVLLDLSLPGMDGLTLTRQLKSESSTKDLKIVALTAFAMAGDDKKAFDAGCDGYITKPFDIVILANKVKDFLQ